MSNPATILYYLYGSRRLANRNQMLFVQKRDESIRTVWTLMSFSGLCVRVVVVCWWYWPIVVDGISININPSLAINRGKELNGCKDGWMDPSWFSLLMFVGREKCDCSRDGVQIVETQRLGVRLQQIGRGISFKDDTHLIETSSNTFFLLVPCFVIWLLLHRLLFIRWSSFLSFFRFRPVRYFPSSTVGPGCRHCCPI